MNKGNENTLFQKNLEVFARRYPECVDKFVNKEYKSNENVEIEVEQAYTGEPILTIEKDGQKRYLAGRYAPERPFLDWIDRQDRIYDETVLFVVGMGNWLQIEALLHNVDKKVTIILYEPCVEIFENVMLNYNVADILEEYNLGLVVEQINPEYLITFFSACIHRETMSLTKVYISGNYATLFPTMVKEKVEELKKFFEGTMITWNTMIRYTDVVGENVLNNVSFLYNGYNILQYRDLLPKDVPAIVVSAGPSLNKNIKMLKNAVGKCCIIACDTAIKPLLNEGIQPHFVAIVDGKKPALLFEHPDFSKSALLTSTVVAKDVMNLHRGKKVFYGGANQYEKGVLKAINDKREDEKLEMVPLLTGGSVANNAFSFAIALGAKTIILMGQDLAMTGNKTHADGTFKDKMEDIDTKSGEYFEVESIDGGKILTRADFNHYRKWFEDRIKELNEEGIKIIDATEGGAKIHGADIMTLDEAIKWYCVNACDLEEKIASMPPMLSEQDKIQFLEYIGNTEKKLEEIRDKVNRGIGCYDKMIKLAKKKSLNTKEYLKIYGKVKNINDFMENDSVARFVMDNLEEMQNAMLSTMYMSKENEQDERIILAQKGKVILETVLPMIDTLEEIAKDTVMQYKGDDSILYAKYFS